MYLADCHVHSRVSSDGRFSMAEMAEAALAAGMDELCFTDHFDPVEGRSLVFRKTFDWSAFLSEFADVTARLGGRIRLRLGVELGDAQADFSAVERLIAPMPPLDFVLGSVHMLSPNFGLQDLAWLREPDEAACYAEIEDYLRQTLAMARWGRFDVLGHLTLPLRYMNEQRGFHVSLDDYAPQVESVLRALIENGCGIEVNTNRGGPPLPGEKWLRLYRSLGGELVTLGSDAHRLEHVGCGIREGQDLLRSCGFTRFCTFSARKPRWHPL